MTPMSRNNSATPLMGFSVYQPTIGATLQFFPAMGSKQLDDMIDAYVPGHAPILDKRATVSMEFFEHTIATGELFKFFMVYPAPSSANPSPTMDSGYYSNFSTSPAMSDSQWVNPTPRMASPSSSNKATPVSDFASLPGMKIMTKDGRDVTNSASRGCKTKEQRDHAHLMRIIKACDSCKRKKTKCDPSHKRTSASTSSAKVTKRASRNSRPAAAPPQIAARQASFTPEFDQIMSASSSSLDSLFADSLITPADSFSMEWDQFIQYDEEPAETIPYDYDFFLDPVDYLSPATASFSSSSTSPSQLPITPIDRDVHITGDPNVGQNHKPILPYLNSGVVEAGSNYVDFNLYSPPSSFLDEELGLAREVAASPIQSQRFSHHRHRRTDGQQAFEGSAAAFESRGGAVDNEPMNSYRGDVTDSLENYVSHDTPNYMCQWPDSTVMHDATSPGRALRPQHTGLPSNGRGVSSRAVVNPMPTPWIVDNILEGVTSNGLYERDTIEERVLARALHDPARLDRNRRESTLRPNTADHAADGVQKRQLALQTSDVSPSEIASTANTTQSSSPQRHTIRSCGQDEVNSAESSATTSRTTSGLNTRTTDNVASVTAHRRNSSDNTRRHQPATMAHGAMSPALSVETPASSLSSMIAVRSSAVISRARSQILPALHAHANRNTLMTRTLALAPAAIGHSLIQQNSSTTVLWDSATGRQHAAGPSENVHPTTSQSMTSRGWLTISWMTDIRVLPATLSLVSHIAMTSGNSPTKHLSVVVFTVLFFIGLYQPWLLVSFLAISASSLIRRLHRLQGYPSSLGTKVRSSVPPPPQRLSFAKQLHIHPIEHLKASSTKCLHLVRCDLSRKLTRWTHPLGPSPARQQPPRGVENQATVLI